MKIIIVTTHFFPENFKANDMAFELARRGHDVTVLTPIPDYPQGKFYDGYGLFKKRREVVNGVKVIRTVVIPRHDGTAKWLGLNYLSYTLFATLEGLWLGITKKYDSVIVHEPSPIMVGIPAVLIKKLQRIPLHFWVLDLWPESLSATGAIKNKSILSVFNQLVKWIYKNCDSILIGSKGYRKSINNKGNFNNKIHYFPNWVEESLTVSKNDNSLTDLPPGFNVVIAGNMGDAQDLPHVMEAAKELKGRGINFVFIGDGRKREYVESFAKKEGLQSQICCLGRFPIETMPHFFSQANVLFLALKDTEIFALTAPSRLQAYMSAGKPIVAMINGDGADLIAEADCGWSVPAGDSKSLAELLLRLSNEDECIMIEKGSKGKRYSDLHFNFKKCMDHLESIISN